MSKSPSKRGNDLHRFQRQSITPANGVVRRMAELVLHDRPASGPRQRRCNVANCGPAKRRFTAEEVRAMRGRWSAGERICDLAREFEMSTIAMTYLLDGTNYTWVR